MKDRNMILNFYIERKPKKKRSDQPIYLQITGLVPGMKTKLNTGERIHPRFWDNVKQQPRRNSEGSAELNERLTKIQTDVKKIYRDLMNDSEEITALTITDKMREYFNRTKIKPLSFFDVYDLHIQTKRSGISPQTVTKFTVLRNHLMRFQEYIKTPITFERVDLLFMERFISYLFTERRFTNNTAYKLIGIFKIFLNWATDRKLNRNLEFKRFKGKETETEVVYLTELELLKIFSADLTANRKLANVRDAFCFACFTGARFSDVSRIDREDIKQDTWLLRTKKTKDLLEIPLSDYAIEILSRHKDDARPLPSISNQKMNKYLKELCQMLEINELCKSVRYRGAERIETVSPKYELISTHTARRTFITLSLEKGMRQETLMKLTGHKDVKMMRKYLKITDKVKQKEMQTVWKKEPIKLKLLSN